jgi:hypothetical protein
MEQFKKQISKIQTTNIINYFKNKGDNAIIDFITTHINIENLLEKYSIHNPLEQVEELIKNNLQTICKLKVEEDDIYSSSGIASSTGDCNLLTKLIKAFPKKECEILNIKPFTTEGDTEVIKLTSDNKPNILVYSHIDNVNISKNNVDEFYKSIKEQNACGILCNKTAGIANKDHFEIDIQDNHVYIFISEHQGDNNLFKLAIKIIYHIYDTLKDNDAIQIDKELLQRLKLEYNYFLISHTKLINSIKFNLIALEKLGLNQLDHFFKRTHINSNDKPYSCQLCGTMFGTDKSLKCHLKLKHAIQLSKTRKSLDENNEDKHTNCDKDKFNKDEFDKDKFDKNIQLGLITFS